MSPDHIDLVLGDNLSGDCAVICCFMLSDSLVLKFEDGRFISAFEIIWALIQT